MAFVLPHIVRQAKLPVSAVAPPSASSLRSKATRLAELEAQAAWFTAHKRPQDSAELQREAARIRESLQ